MLSKADCHFQGRSNTKNVGKIPVKTEKIHLSCRPDPKLRLILLHILHGYSFIPEFKDV